VTEQLEGYRFSDAVRAIYDFTWSEFCDWYLEMSKGRLRDADGRALAQRVLIGVLDAILRLVQPIMPFVAESIWQGAGRSGAATRPADADGCGRERGDRAVAGLSGGLERRRDGIADGAHARTGARGARSAQPLSNRRANPSGT